MTGSEIDRMLEMREDITRLQEQANKLGGPEADMLRVVVRHLARAFSEAERYVNLHARLTGPPV